MLLQEPERNPYDLEFRFLGFPVRISWTFWPMAIIFGFGFSRSLDSVFGELSPGLIPLLLIWTVGLFVSILIHELGHALAFRQYRIESSIVLYYLGGLAIPTSQGGSWGGGSSLTPKQSMWVSFAGPLAQFGSAVIVIAVCRYAGFLAPVPWPLSELSFLREGQTISSVALLAMVAMYLYPSVLWALLNLLPVWPLDGGRIVGSLVQIFGGTMIQALWIGVFASGVMVAWAFSTRETYLAMMFLLLGINNYQAIQQLSGPRY